MTETQYLWAWAAYLAGATGCLTSLWFMIRRWPTRLRRLIMVTIAMLLYLPGLVKPDADYLGPAFLISLFDGLTHGVEAMWRCGKAVALVTPVAALVALFLPVKRSKASPETSSDNGDQRSSREKQPARPGHQPASGKPPRKEPVY